MEISCPASAHWGEPQDVSETPVLPTAASAGGKRKVLKMPGLDHRAQPDAWPPLWLFTMSLFSQEFLKKTGASASLWLPPHPPGLGKSGQGPGKEFLGTPRREPRNRQGHATPDPCPEALHYDSNIRLLWIDVNCDLAGRACACPGSIWAARTEVSPYLCQLRVKPGTLRSRETAGHSAR